MGNTENKIMENYIRINDDEVFIGNVIANELLKVKNTIASLSNDICFLRTSLEKYKNILNAFLGASREMLSAIDELRKEAVNEDNKNDAHFNEYLIDELIDLVQKVENMFARFTPLQKPDLKKNHLYIELIPYLADSMEILKEILSSYFKVYSVADYESDDPNMFSDFEKKMLENYKYFGDSDPQDRMPQVLHAGFYREYVKIVKGVPRTYCRLIKPIVKTSLEIY